MAATSSDRQCPKELFEDAVHRIESAEEGSAERIDELLQEYGDDARLHFLHGSLLAGKKRYAEAASRMARAVELAPDNSIYRFQYGFLELTSGRGEEAQRIWAPLETLDENHPLRLFARGLGHLVRDEFDETIALLKRGMARNAENGPLNDDMRLIVEELDTLRCGSSPATPRSSVQALLQQYAARATKH